MPGWTCGRCTFINHELMDNCEMCEAPKEAAEIPYLGEATPESQTAINSSGEDLPMEQTTQSESPSGPSLDRPEVPPQQTTPGPSADDMLNNMDTETNPGLDPTGTGQVDLLSRASMEANSPVSPKESLSLSGSNGAFATGSALPEPLTPVVLHSLDTKSDVESPMSEPEQINGAMCMSSPDTANGGEDNGWSFLDNEVRIVMIGKTGVGKSTTGNNILGSGSFKSSASGASVTKKCQLGWASRYGRDIQVIDTPGLFDTGMTNEDITREIVKCIGMTSPGPHAFLLVIRLDRFTAEEQATVEHFINIFGKDMLKYLVVLFTRMDDLKYDGTTLDEYLQNVPPDLKNLLDACQNRRIGFDNRASQEERDKDVQDLLKLIDGMVTSNGGGHYTNEMFEEAERIIAEQEEEHLKQSRERMKQEMARLREEVEEELRKKEEEKRKDLEQMKGKLSELGIDEDDEEWVHVFGTPDMSPIDEPIEMASVTPQASQGASAAQPSAMYSKFEATSNIKETTPPVEGKPASISSAEDGDKRSKTESKTTDDPSQPRTSSSDSSNENSLFSSGQAQQGSMYETDSYTGSRQTPTNQNFISNESMQQERKSIHQREVEELRERRARLEAKHQMDKERMRADYMARQSEALHEYNRRHQESRQRYREEMHNVNSNVFSRMFGAMKRIIKSTTTSIGRGFQSLFSGVYGRSSSCHGHSF